jgi:hypothetical protein
MNPVLLVRPGVISKYELRHAAKYFRVEESRMRCSDSLVVGRYSVTPFYDELDRDLRIAGGRLINSLAEHAWISEFRYYDVLRSFTPETWDASSFPFCQHEGPFVVKGKLSSKKRRWSTQMFAATKSAAIEIGKQLLDDAEIGEQGVIYRRFVPLKTFEIGAHGLPYTNEWRFFFVKEELLSQGYYWSMSDCVDRAEMTEAGVAFARSVAKIAAAHTTFFAVDIAETEQGDWILIEINDGQMAAPSENDLDQLFGNLRKAVLGLESGVSS